MLTLTHSVQLVPREHHAGNTMTTTHLSPLVAGPHATCDSPTTSIMGGSNSELLRPHQQTRGQSNGMWYGSQYRKQQDHDQQLEQYQCRYQHEWPEVRIDDQYQVRKSISVHELRLLGRYPH